MAKKADKKDPEEKARRKLADAQLKLHVAEDRHMQAREEGKQEIEQARMRAARRLTKAGEEVEKRREQVSRAEGRLIVLTGETQSSDAPHTEGSQDVISGPILDQDGEAEVFVTDGLEAAAAHVSDESPDPSTFNAGAIQLREREMRALRALHEDFGDRGANVTEWRAAAGMPNTTFARARRALLVHGLVSQDGDGARGTRYSASRLGQDMVSV
ncbi:MAG: hypothetical protein ACR2JC_04890 [Chloroflexota bacterium]|nr:MAG: hypothetical protein DLM70_17540 [Chloroflexota bacterium]